MVWFYSALWTDFTPPLTLGFPTFNAFGGVLGMCICNDRRWPETFRVMGLQGAELVMVGYNTPDHYPPAPEHDHLQNFHNHLVMQAGAYQNGTWIVGVAKAGHEEGCDLIGGTCIIAPTGEIVAECKTLGGGFSGAIWRPAWTGSGNFLWVL